MKVQVYRDANGEFRWRAIDGNNRIIANSGEGYVDLGGAERGFQNVIEEMRGDVVLVGERNMVQHFRTEAQRQTLGSGATSKPSEEVISSYVSTRQAALPMVPAEEDSKAS